MIQENEVRDVVNYAILEWDFTEECSDVATDRITKAYCVERGIMSKETSIRDLIRDAINYALEDEYTQAVIDETVDTYIEGSKDEITSLGNRLQATDQQIRDAMEWVADELYGGDPDDDYLQHVNDLINRYFAKRRKHD